MRKIIALDLLKPTQESGESWGKGSGVGSSVFLLSRGSPQGFTSSDLRRERERPQKGKDRWRGRGGLGN